VSVCLSVYTSIVVMQWLSKNVPTATKICWKPRIYAIRNASKESERLVLPTTSY
jgi:hypothetical protein